MTGSFRRAKGHSWRPQPDLGTLLGGTARFPGRRGSSIFRKAGVEEYF